MGSLFINPLSHWTLRGQLFSTSTGIYSENGFGIPASEWLLWTRAGREPCPHESQRIICAGCWVWGSKPTQRWCRRGVSYQKGLRRCQRHSMDRPHILGTSTRECMHRRWVVQVTPRTKLQHRKHFSAMPNAGDHCIAKTRESCQCEIQARDTDSSLLLCAIFHYRTTGKHTLSSDIIPKASC